MPQCNYKTGEIIAKIVYYGPAYCGKTTTLQWLHKRFKPEQIGQLFSLATAGDRTLFFDLFPFTFGRIDGVTFRLKVYTVPGEVKYNATRKMVLTGADAVVFVVDSEIKRFQDNLVSLQNLSENFGAKGIDLRTFPLVFQYNKRDLPDILPLEVLDSKLNLAHLPSFASVAIDPNDWGVPESFITIVSTLFKSFDGMRTFGKKSDAQNIPMRLEQILRAKLNMS